MKPPPLIQYREVGADGYPYAWHHSIGDQPAIKNYIRELAGDRCVRCGHPYMKGENELVVDLVSDTLVSWSPCDGRCSHPRTMHDTRWRYLEDSGDYLRGMPTLLDMEQGAIRIESMWRILTVHHLDEDKANCRWWNLASLCQRCHLRMQRGVVMGRPYHFEHSDWFKPYAAGFYAWKYLGEDLSRLEVAARQDELLKLEHRFTQDVLF